MTNSPQSYWQLLKTYLGFQRNRVGMLAVLVLGIIGLQLANPRLIRYFLDELASGGGMRQLLGAAGLFMAITILTQVVRVAATYLSEIVGWTATNALRVDLATHCLGLDMAFHKTHSAGELIERVDGDVNELANFFSQMILTLIGNGLLFCGVLILLWIEGWQIGLVITCVAILSVLAINQLRHRITPRWEALRGADAALFGYIEERLNGTEDIQTCGAKPAVMSGLIAQLETRWLAAKNALPVDVWLISMPIWVFGLAYAGAHAVTGFLFESKGISVGSVYLIFHYIGMIEGPMWQTMDMVDKFQRAAAAINRVHKLFQIQPTILDGAGVDLPQGPLAVEFSHVSFRYDDMVTSCQSSAPNAPATTTNNGASQNGVRLSSDHYRNSILERSSEVVIRNVSFRLNPGEILGLLGRTGSGKSTLSKLLFRFYDPTEGEILIGDGEFMHDLREARRQDLHGQVGMVTQDVQLFHATVRDNLTLFDGSIADARVLSVLQDVGLDAWLKGLPQGLDTYLSGADAGLSAGEAQLLAFTRVFLADPGLIILDEASSRLDRATERRIETALDHLLTNRTAIIIAHRLSTIQRADKILILDQGGVGEYGGRELLAQDQESLFSRLLRTGQEEAIAT